MKVNFERLHWENYPSLETPVNADNLNRLEEGVAGLYSDLAEIEEELGDGVGEYVTGWLDDHVTPTGSAVIVDDTLTIQGAAADAKKVGEALDDVTEPIQEQLSDLKDDFHEYHSELGAGYADQLVSSIQMEDKTPYNFRKVPYDATLEKVEGIVGCDVVVNQLAKNINSSNWRAESGVTATFTDGVVSFSSTTVNYGVKCNTEAVKGNHIYFLAIQAKSASVCTARLFYGGSGGASTNVNCTTSYALTEKIAKAPSSANGGDVYVFPLDDAGLNNQIDAKDIEVVDLTQTFGTQIADYVYNLEQSTAGAGVAWLKANFPKIFNAGYVPYNAGTMVHVSGLSAKKTVGFNQWDEVWEVGILDATTGEPIGNSNNIRSKNYIPVMPNANYYIACESGGTVIIFGYDQDKNMVKRLHYNTFNAVFAISDDRIKYIKFATMADSGNYGSVYKNDICINLSDTSRNGTYEPYVQHTYPLDSTIDLHGILKLDSNNQLYADGDVYKADGTVTRNYTKRAYQSGDESLANAITDGTNTVVKLSTPTTETAEPYNPNQICDPNGTEEYISDTVAPVGHTTKYPLDIAGRLDNILTMPTANGTYVLRATVNNGKVTYSWVSA